VDLPEGTDITAVGVPRNLRSTEQCQALFGGLESPGRRHPGSARSAGIVSLGSTRGGLKSLVAELPEMWIQQKTIGLTTKSLKVAILEF